MLRFAAREADIIGINATMTAGKVDESAFDTMTAEAVDDKVAIVGETATEADRLDSIEMNIRAFMVFVTDDVESATNTLVEFTGRSPEMIAASPFVLIGPPERIIELLLERRERWGFSYVIVGQNDVDAFAPVVAALAGT